MAMAVGQDTKLELANEAAVRSVELLGAGDRLGVMHVDTAVQWTVPLGPVRSPSRPEAIRAVGPGRRRHLRRSHAAAAYAALAKENVNLKHLLLFADGADAENAPRLRAGERRQGARHHHQRGLAGPRTGRGRAGAHEQAGDGRFYLIEDATRLPAVFAQETVLAARSSINEVAFRRGSSVSAPRLRGIDWQRRRLSGYVVTIPKGRAQVLLSGPEGDPLLATWSVGIGRAAAFTSDYKDRWGVAWTGWAGAAKLFGQLGRDLARRADDARVRLEADASGGELRLRASVADERGRTQSFRRLVVNVAAPDGSATRWRSTRSARACTARRCRPRAPAPTWRPRRRADRRKRRPAPCSPGDELRPTGTDRGLLRRIAELTGGKLRDTLAGIFPDRDAERFAYTPLGGWL